jgi:hypothetical protein
MDAPALRAALIVVGMAFVAIAAVAAGRRPWWTVSVTALVVLALVANAIVASSLTFAHTI